MCDHLEFYRERFLQKGESQISSSGDSFTGQGLCWGSHVPGVFPDSPLPGRCRLLRKQVRFGSSLTSPGSAETSDQRTRAAPSASQSERRRRGLQFSQRSSGRRTKACWVMCVYPPL